ncbi:MAG: hypothetical protein IKR98_05950 [Bacteroidaceae bacterium]|nr:hypothetical protein [Bacteroidaceae bacterium]
MAEEETQYHHHHHHHSEESHNGEHHSGEHASSGEHEHNGEHHHHHHHHSSTGKHKHHHHVSRREAKRKWARKMGIMAAVSICAVLLTLMIFLYGSSNRPLYPHIVVALPAFMIFGAVSGYVVYRIIKREQKKEGL